MWSMHHCDQWPDLDAVEEPRDAGRALYVGGFVLADSFGTLLRNIGETYLAAAWSRLSASLTAFDVAPNDLSWGSMHPGETYLENKTQHAPSDFLGWTSRELQNFDEDPRYQQLDMALRQGTPKLRCAVTWRSLKWNIAPNNFGLALRLIEAMYTDGGPEWNPDLVLAEQPSPTEPWCKVAKAIRDDNQSDVDQALAEAEQQYSPLGYRIVVRANAAWVTNWGDRYTVRIPST